MPAEAGIMRRLSWGRLSEKFKKKARKAMREKSLLGIAMQQRKEIGILAAELGIPEKRLSEYFNSLKLKNMGFQESVNTLVETLSQMRELAQKTEVSKKTLRHFLERKGIEWVMKEMGQRAQQIDAMQAMRPAA